MMAPVMSMRPLVPVTTPWHVVSMMDLQRVTECANYLGLLSRNRNINIFLRFGDSPIGKIKNPPKQNQG